MGLERGSLSLVSTTEELVGRNSSGSGLERRKYGRRGPSCWPRGTINQRKSALTSPTSSDLSVGIVRSRTQATKFTSPSSSHCSPEATEDSEVHTSIFRNKFVVDEILRKPALSSTRMAITEMFIPLVNLRFLHYRHSICFFKHWQCLWRRFV
jgi:hypothetical protein